MSFRLHIDLGNAAFGDDPAAEVVRILRRVAHDVERGKVAGAIRDRNGNRVGEWLVEEA